MRDNTVFLRLEGPLQAWGTCSRFKIRETGLEPTKSGIAGLICCAMGLRRLDAEVTGWLQRLNALKMGVRIDRPGWLWRDYQTVGAGFGVLQAEGGIKHTGASGNIEPVECWRDYLCDASFVVALRGDEDTIKVVAENLADPEWLIYLGCKCCPPSRPVLVRTDRIDDLESAFTAIDWEPRMPGDAMPAGGLRSVKDIERPDELASAEARQDVAVRFRPPVHGTRYVVVMRITPRITDRPHMSPCPRPYRGWPKNNSVWRNFTKPARMDRDHDLCVFCKLPAQPVHHVDYANAPDHEDVEKDLRSLCDICHSAVTMLEYGLGLGEKRIDPTKPRWRTDILKKRDEILRDRVPLHLGRKRLPLDEEN